MPCHIVAGPEEEEHEQYRSASAAWAVLTYASHPSLIACTVAELLCDAAMTDAVGVLAGP